MSANEGKPIADLEARLAEALERAERAEQALAAAGPPSSYMRAAAEEVRSNERLMRAVFTSASDAMVLLDDEGRYVDVNPAMCQLLMETRATLLRTTLGAYAQDPSGSAKIFQEMRASGQARGRSVARRADGSLRTLDVLATAGIGSGLHLIVVRDVTDERAAAASLARAESELRRSDALFRAMVEKSAEGSVLFTPEGRVLYMSNHSRELLGVGPDESVGTSGFDRVHADDHGAVREGIERAMASGAATLVCRFLHRDGSVRWLEATITNLLNDPDIGALVANVRDVTDLRVAAIERERLIVSLSFERSRLGALLEKAPAFIAVLRGPSLVFELANAAFYAVVGERPLIGRPLADAVPEFADQGLVDVAEKVFATGQDVVAKELLSFFSRGPSSSADRRFVNMVVQPIVEADGVRSGVFIHGVDVTEESLAKRRVEAQFNGVPVPTYVWKRAVSPGGIDFVLLDYNHAAAKISNGNIALFRGKSAREVFAFDGDALTDIERCLEAEETFQREIERPTTFAPTQAKRFLITYSPAPPDVVLTHMEDVTERRRLEEQLRQAQKMEAIGRLAGGVAHDFNNILSIILSYSSLIAEQLESGDPMREDLEQVSEAALRAVDLTRQLLAFSRQQVLEPHLMSISEAVTGLEKMLRRLLGEDIDLSLRPRATRRMKADRGQIEQIIMNLVVNARDAMPEGGKLTVETCDTDLDEPDATDQVTTQPGAYVTLTVSDDGTGMDDATRTRIFEPFFTTKGPGKGTGLGLSTVFGIVQQSGGTIHVASQPGRGTSFRIHFPEASDDSDAWKTAAPSRAQPGGRETILVVEDEEPLRMLAVRILRRVGYEVLEASDGEAAIAVADAYPGPIHLLLTDVVMPRLNGRMLADRLSASRAGIKTLFMSGYTDDASVLSRVLASKVAFIQEPLTPAVLLDRVRDVLDERARRR